MIDYADVIVDLQAGDTGKGKVAHHLCKRKDEYDCVIRYNGGGNAGHTVYHNGEKIVTHFLPVGLLHGITSIIGPGCVVDPIKLEEELDEVEKFYPNSRKNLWIDKRVHIIRPEYVEEDSKDTEIGTTKTGNGPTYRHKYGRTGLRAEDCYEVQDYICDIYEYLHGLPSRRILFEGAQGFELDIDWGDYPYVTSSHCTVGSAILNGVPPQYIRKVWGVAKAYRTYVGSKEFEGDDPIFQKIRELGSEFGATTGRPRQVDWINLDDLATAINVNGVTDLIINKLDVLEKLGIIKGYWNLELIEFHTIQKFKDIVEDYLIKRCPTLTNLTFSYSQFEI